MTTHLLESVQALAIAAGARIMAIYTTADFSITAKDDNSPLTAADLAAHDTIVAGLHTLTPDIPVLSEESAAIPYTERRTWSRFWLVDPLDGTKEFIKRNGEFTVNIALIEDHVPVLGVVYLPARDITYCAARGQGAFRQDAGQPAQPIRVQPRTSGPLRIVGSRSHGDERLQTFSERLGEHELVVAGSSLKFCMVAEGAADLYPRFGPTSEWDTAAAQCVVEEAGGAVTDLTGARLRYNTGDSILNPEFLVSADPTRDWLAALTA